MIAKTKAKSKKPRGSARADRLAGAGHTVPNEIAKDMAIKPSVVLAWIASGELPATNVAVNPRSERPRWRVALTDLEAFKARRAAGGPKPARAVNRKAVDRNTIQFY